MMGKKSVISKKSDREYITDFSEFFFLQFQIFVSAKIEIFFFY